MLEHAAFEARQFVIRIEAPRCAAHAKPGSFAHITCDPNDPDAPAAVAHARRRRAPAGSISSTRSRAPALRPRAAARRARRCRCSGPSAAASRRMPRAPARAPDRRRRRHPADGVPRRAPARAHGCGLAAARPHGLGDPVPVPQPRSRTLVDGIADSHLPACRCSRIGASPAAWRVAPALPAASTGS